MGGLGCGSLVGGWVADRLTRRGNLATFAAAELAVGIFGFFSAALYYDVLYLRLGHLAAQTAAMPALLFASLLWPTFFMGMSLPLLARALTADDRRRGADRRGALRPERAWVRASGRSSPRGGCCRASVSKAACASARC